jgi:hypothetical protein
MRAISSTSAAGEQQQNPQSGSGVPFGTVGYL